MSLDTYKSRSLPSLGCSVIQGSKLSSILYIIYTNEIPLLPKFISDNDLNINAEMLTENKHNEWVKEIKNNDTEHLIVNFIDDSTNLISNCDYKILIKYLNVFYTLVKKFYDVNILRINSDEMELLVSCKNTLQYNADKIFMWVEGYKISEKPVQKYWVLR